MPDLPTPRDASPGSSSSPISDRSRPGVPAWAGFADVLGIGFLIAALGLSIGGTVRLFFGDLRVSLGSPGRALLLGVALLALRHWRVPTPPVHRRIVDGLRSYWADPGLRAVSAHYWTIRLSILLVGYLAVGAFGLPARGIWRVSDHELANLPGRWDAGWYLGLATDGYRYRAGGGQQNVAFMPAFPVAMRLAAAFAGVSQEGLRNLRGSDRARMLWAGLVLSLLAGWLASLMLFHLAREWLEAEEAVAAVLLLHAYPFALFYGAPYTEALFLLACVAALRMYTRERWLAATALGLLAGVTRPNGFLLSVLLGLLLLGRLRSVIRSRDDGHPLPRVTSWFGPLVAAAAPVASVLLFSAFVYRLTGHPFTWARLHSAWGREYRSLTSLAESYYTTIVDGGLYAYTVSAPIDALNLAAVLLALAAIVPVARRFGLAYGAFLAAVVVPPLTMGGVLSMGRVTATAFPVFLWLGAFVPRRLRMPLVMCFLVLQSLAAALFFTWRPLF